MDIRDFIFKINGIEPTQETIVKYGWAFNVCGLSIRLYKHMMNSVTLNPKFHQMARVIIQQLFTNYGTYDEVSTGEWKLVVEYTDDDAPMKIDLGQLNILMDILKDSIDSGGVSSCSEIAIIDQTIPVTTHLIPLNGDDITPIILGVLPTEVSGTINDTIHLEFKPYVLTMKPI